jgi:hypothetical protein
VPRELSVSDNLLLPERVLGVTSMNILLRCQRFWTDVILSFDFRSHCEFDRLHGDPDGAESSPPG